MLSFANKFSISVQLTVFLDHILLLAELAQQNSNFFKIAVWQNDSMKLNYRGFTFICTSFFDRFFSFEVLFLFFCFQIDQWIKSLETSQLCKTSVCHSWAFIDPKKHLYDYGFHTRFVVSLFSNQPSVREYTLHLLVTS